MEGQAPSPDVHHGGDAAEEPVFVHPGSADRVRHVGDGGVAAVVDDVHRQQGHPRGDHGLPAARGVAVAAGQFRSASRSL